MSLLKLIDKPKVTLIPQELEGPRGGIFAIRKFCLCHVFYFFLRIKFLDPFCISMI